MNDTMREYFPMLRTRKEVLDLIQASERLTEQFDSWEEEHQEDFLDFCTGVKGVKILYDGFFKEVFSPEYHVERLEEFLSCKLRSNGMPVPLLRNGYSIFNGTKYR